MRAVRGRRALLDGISLTALSAMSAGPAFAADMSVIGTSEVLTAALVAGLGLFSALSGVAMLRARRREEGIRREAEDEIAGLNARLARAEALVRAEDQVIVIWDEPGGPPREAEGAITTLRGIPSDSMGLVTFDAWLTPDSAAALKGVVSALRGRGEGFSLTVRTRRGDHLEAEGRCVGASALLRFRDLSPERRELARIAERHAALVRELDSLKALLGDVAHLVWVRDEAGTLRWVNAAYAKAVDVNDTATAVARGLEFLDAPARKDAGEVIAHGKTWRRRIVAVVSGARRVFDVVVVPIPNGSAGLATDVSEIEAGRKDMERLFAAHQRTLDNLPTPVAVFGGDQRLVYHNAAWRELWGLDAAFLGDKPDESAILDWLRQARKLPEQANYREWKAQHLDSYRSVEPRESWWHLPDGQTIRTYVHPNPQGGVTVIQENVTEVLDLKSRNLASERILRETLDGLSDAVVVFGSDGRLKVSNPAFANLWRIDAATLVKGPHIDQVVAACRGVHPDPGVWERLKSAVTDFEERVPVATRVERRDGTIIDLASVPLPDGATLLTFVDVTASVNVERALSERAKALNEKNEALVVADRLKNTFVQHVSYELRSPLTNIIGFAQLLSDPGIGPLNDKQREYMGYIMASSSSLLAIINDILDLATIDAGVMQLDLTRVDVTETMDAAAEGIRDRLMEENISLSIVAPADIGAFTADAKRVRQVLYNLLSNAAGFSESGQTITMRAHRERSGDVVFEVADQGRGMDPDTLARVFERFETSTAGSRHRGAGLGLSIVKSFVELHGGRVEITSQPGSGTVVAVRFPPVARESLPLTGTAA